MHRYDIDKIKKTKQHSGNCGIYIVTTRSILIFEFSLFRRENRNKSTFSMFRYEAYGFRISLPGEALRELGTCTEIYETLYSIATDASLECIDRDASET